jgi:hypothetical protein
MYPFTLLAYETYHANLAGESPDARYFRLKEWYDELCYAQANPETPSDFEEIKFLQTQVNCDRFLLMKQYFESIKEETN